MANITKANLRNQLRRKLLLPIILGVFITGLYAGIIIYIKGPGWVSNVQQETVSFEGTNLYLLANSASFLVKVLLQKVSDDLLIIDTLFNNTVYGNVQFDLPVSSGNYFINAKQLAENQDGILYSMPGYDASINGSKYRHMWYIIDSATSGNINDGTYDSIPSNYQYYYQNFTTLLPFLVSNLDPTYYEMFYGPYTEVFNNIGGFYIEFPAQAKYSKYVNYSSPKGSEETFFNYATRPWYIQMIDSNVPIHTVEFIYPYRFIGGSFGYTACLYLTGTISTPKGMICSDYVLDPIKNYISSTSAAKQAIYVIIDKQEYRILSYSGEDRTTDDVNNITQVIFNTQDLTTQEQFDFDNQFVALANSYVAYYNYSMNYTNNGQSYLLTMSKFDIRISKDHTLPKKEYFLALCIPQSIIISAFDGLSTEVNNRILLQNGILIALVASLIVVALFLVTWVARLVAAPIDKLIKLLYEISGEIYEEDDEANKKSNQKLRVLLRCIPNLETLSLETNELHNLFLVMRQVIFYSRDAAQAKNDAVAIINYSNALAIYNQYNMIRGVGTTHYNIGNIHFKNKRYEEALTSYKEATTCSRKELDYLITIEKKMADDISTINSVSKIINRGKHDQLYNLDIYLKVRAEIEESHCKRTYMQAQCYFEMGKDASYKKSKSHNQSIRTLLYEVISIDNTAKKNQDRVILCLLDVADTYLAIERFDDARRNLKEGEEMIKVYQQQFYGYEDDPSRVSIPPEILRSKLYLLNGKFYQGQSNLKKACEEYTNAIENGEHYDPEIRRVCLKHLKEIFLRAKILENAPNIERILNSMNNLRKDIVLLLDYSQSMQETKKINFAITNLLKLFDRFIHPEDRVGFIRFNMNCEIVFSLSEKRKNTLFLRRNIEDSFKPAGGTALYNAIAEGLRLFLKAEPRNSHKVIIAITDGDDNESRVSYEQIYRKLLKSDITLVMLGLGLHGSVKRKLGYLCKATTDGLFLDSPTQEDLNVAFQSVTNLFFGAEQSRIFEVAKF